MSRNSDRRKIKDVQNVTGQHALQKIAALQPVQFRHIDEDPNRPETIGFIAQDFGAVFPDLIRKRKGDDGVKPIKKPKPPRPVEPPQTPAQPAPTDPGPANPPGTGGGTTTPVSGGPRTLASLLTDDPIPGPGEAATTAPAQELAAEESDEESPVDIDSGYSILSFEELIPLLVGCIKELKTALEESKAKVSELEKKVQKLQPTLTA